MKIGIDAGAISETDDRLKVGVYRVTLELLKALSQIDKDNQYRLYSYAPIPRTIMSQLDRNMVNIVLKPSLGYMQVRLPLKLAMYPVDIFLGLAQAIPFGAHHAISFIYDLGFIHAPKEYGETAERLKKQTDEAVNRSSHIITISETTKKDIIEIYHKEKSRITVAYPGVSAVFERTGKEHIHPRPYFLSVGLLKPSKHIPTAIRAFGLFLKKIRKPFDLVIVGGDTKLDPSIRETVRNLHLENRILFTGYVPDEEVAEWYRGAESLIALSTHEGFCLPAAEAITCGCPVIFSKDGALPEIVGEAGIRLPTNDILDIARSMLVMTNKKSTRTEYMKKALVQSRKYSWDQFAQHVQTLFTRV